MGSTILKIAIFVIAVVSGAIFFFAKSDSTESSAGNILASKTASNATQPAAQITTPQPQPAPTFQWDNSDDLPAEDGPPEAPTSDFGFGADEEGDEVGQTIESFDSDSFNADSNVTPSTEDGLSETDSSSLDESSSFDDVENIEPPSAPEPDNDFAEENTPFPENDSTADQDFASESNSPNSNPLENDSFENDPIEVDSRGNDLSDSEAFSMNDDKQDDDEFDSFSTDDSPGDTNQNSLSSAEPESTLSDLGDTRDLNADQFSNTENSNSGNSERSLEDTSELLEEPQNVPETAEPIETATSDLQLDSQTNSSLNRRTSLPNEVTTNEITQPAPSQNDLQAVTDGPTHRIAMEQDAVLGRSGIIDNNSLSGELINQSSAVPVPTPVTQANPVPFDHMPMPAVTEPMESGTEVVDVPKQFSGECFQSEIEEFGSQLFWPSTSKLITEADAGNAMAPVNQPISEPVDQTVSRPTKDELINFGPQEPGIIFDTDTSGDCAQSPAPTMTTKPGTSTPLLAPAPSTSTTPAPSTWSPCSPESAPRVRYIWIIPKCECKKPPKCCGK